MLNIFNKTPRTVSISVWNATTSAEQNLVIPNTHYMWPDPGEKITHVRFEGGEWIAVQDEIYSIYRDASDKLQVAKGADFCKRCLEHDGVPSSAFTNLRCDRCGEKTPLRKKGEKVAVEVGAAAALALVIAAFSSED